ncbi:polyketide synthase module [Longilinea arvoryzae]|uniref:Polyketide synthase module n=1 Tax=Longilinea arvoryzae TaxID=360412 RepID=A0A0S7BM63_9CHLR|nr:type I polyketide synthase [Longilinea arvoryzae]GAP15606.1 polyketide synthase module [Longilinea arvoryzae]
MLDPKAVAIVGLGAILPDAPDVASFWRNIQAGRYSITEVPPERWRVDLYYHPDAHQPDKTYSKIGAWVRDFHLEPLKMGIAIPPRLLDQMDPAQQWAIAASHQALSDYGYPQRPLDPARVAVILGNALAGEYHYMSSFRIRVPEYTDALTQTEAFRSLPADVQRALLEGLRAEIDARLRPVTEDTMPGELSNIIAGRVANVFNFSGANYVTDAACASSLAAIQNAMEGLAAGYFDAVLAGGVDRNMGPEAFVKFSKIGALSPDGSRPYADGANGFVMGEGAAIFLLKRLADAERDGDRIYAVIRGVGSSSDGKGKGITAPNPIGQQRAIERAWKNAGVDPRTAAMIEGHGTSTRVGDVVEVGSLNAVFGPLELPVGKIALGSVKSNIGHLKSASGAAALLKMIYALHEQVLPPSVNFEHPNPNIDFAHLPFRVNTTARPWEKKPGDVRRAGISSFGFGGTNFHLVVEEHIPGMLTSDKIILPAVEIQKTPAEAARPAAPETLPAFYRGLLFLSADSTADLRTALEKTLEDARQGKLPGQNVPAPEALARSERLAMDFENGEELIKRAEKTLKAFENDTPMAWNALGAHAVYRGSGKAGKLAFLFPGQGSQYVNMLKDLCEVEPLAAETFREADEVMTPILGKPLTSYIYVDGDPEAIKRAEDALKNTEITQPAVLTANVTLLRLMRKFGFEPDLVIGHSLGEYAALVAAGVLTFAEALEVVSARGREMTKVSMADNGCMAAVSAPLSEVERILKTIDGYVVLANINSPQQSVIGGATAAVDAALEAFQSAGFQAVKIPVSHAFHTQIVAPASDPLRRVIARMDIRQPRLPVIANVTGGLYPTGKEEILDTLAQQVYSPVQFIRGIETMYDQGARVFAEVGPKRVLNALATDILKGKEDVTIVATNHPRKGARTSFNEALCGLYAAGVGPRASAEKRELPVEITAAPEPQPAIISDGRLPLTGSVVITGTGLGLPGRGKHVFEADNVDRILRGDQFIEPLSDEKRRGMLERRVTRLVKSEAGAQMVTIDSLDQTIKLAGQSGDFDLAEEFGVPRDRVEATDISTQLAIAAGIEALRDAGIPLVMRYKRTSTGSALPDRWMLPEPLADETGVIFASAFPGIERLAEESARFSEYQSLNNQITELRDLQGKFPAQAELQQALARRVQELEAQLEKLDYHFDRRFIFRILAMGHSQFAEYIGARGPNTYVNAACSTTTHAVNIAEDWIRTGRCRRVVVIAGDDVTDGNAVNWIGTGLFASGATTTEESLRLAALPFDRRRNGMIMGMGAAALVVESEDAARERGVRAICEVLSTQIANSAYHGSRLNVQHISEVMERLVAMAERRFGLKRSEMASRLMFMSHETYTPARGGSASAEIWALRRTFGAQANRVIISNTKGFTGHTMGVGVEDVVAAKALQTGIVPPIANIGDGFEPDPDLGDLNLSHGGKYEPEYALRLGAGFGSQIAMSLLRRVPGVGERIDASVHRRWMAAVAGYPEVETEIVQHTLRVRDQGQPKQEPRKSQWEFGQGPTLWAAKGVKSDEEKAVLSSVSMRSEEEQKTVFSSTAPQNSVTQNKEEPSSIVDSDIQAYLLSLVSEKTGYPTEMLELDLDLEADLGIDTVKQAELFAAVREHYGIPRREDLRLSDYNTLAKVMNFVKEGVKSEEGKAVLSSVSMRSEEEKKTVLSSTATQNPVTQNNEEPAPMVDLDIQTYLLSLVSEKTGYPTEMLELDLDLEADLGIDTVKQAELFAAVREHYGIPRREDLRLSDYNTLAKVMNFVKEGVKSEEGKAVLSSVSMRSEEEKKTVLSSTATQNPVTQNEEEPSPVVDSDIQTYLLSLVSEKTGYPTEMLELDLDLEADLGIDTVKQAELFAAVREHYGIPRREDLRLSDYNTLAKVMNFVKEGVKSEEVKSDEGMSDEANHESRVPTRVSDITPPASLRRRVPVPVLRPKPGLCLPTGVELGEDSRVLVVADRSGVADALARKLRALKVHVTRLVATSAEEMQRKVTALSAQGPFSGVYFLPGLDVEPTLSEMGLKDWNLHLESRLFTLETLLRNLPETAFLVCGTRLGGLHGYGPQKMATVTGGGLRGLAKAIARERESMAVKVVDFESDRSPAAVAGCLIEETLRDLAVVEVGWEGDLRFGVALVDQALPEPQTRLPENGVFVISGGSGGITAPVLQDLARENRGHFYLLGRSALPSAQDPELTLLRSGREALKGEIVRRLSESGERATPSKVEARLAAIERAAATLETMAQIEKSGGKAVYLACDVTNPQAVEQAVQQVLSAEGKVDVLVHAAGIDHSRKLESKPADEFRQVVAVKAGGFFNLWKTLEAHKALPGFVAVFTSVAGRFGNTGQTDYSAANDLAGRMAAAIHAEHPEIRAAALDWGAWAEVGMASRGYIPRLMQMAGIEMLDPRQAAPLVRAELLAGADSEVVLAGSLGALETPESVEGGLDLEQANIALRAGDPIHTMLSRVAGMSLNEGVLLEAELDPTSEPFLKDHALNGTPVLPGVMGIEGFTVAAKHIASVLGSARAGFDVTRLEDIQFLAPFKFYRNQPRRSTWKARAVRVPEGLVAEVVLESDMLLHNQTVEHMRHFSGRVILQPLAAVDELNTEPPHWNGAYTVPAEEIYKLYFHGPSFQVLAGVQRSGEVVLGKLQRDLPPITLQKDALSSTPILLELCLQTAGAWEAGLTGTLALPSSIGQLRIYKRKTNGAAIYAEVSPIQSPEGELSFDARVVDAKGHVYLEVENYRTSPLPYHAEDEVIQPFKTLVQGN